MPCYKPNLAFQHKTIKQPLRFVGRKQYRNEDGTDPYQSPEYIHYMRNSNWTPLVLPCGQCVHCRLQNSREKAIRSVHEAQLHQENCFLTLTYNDKYLPASGSIEPDTIQKFMKRLRRKFPNTKIRSSGCAEYGTTCKSCKKSKVYCVCSDFIPDIGRPHYHLILYGFNFPDKKPAGVSGNDWSKEQHQIYRSEILNELWSDPDTKESYGYTTIGTVTFESAAYVARYISKKITGDKKDGHYGNRLPERSVAVSNREGIGLPWLKKYYSECLANDFIILKEKKMKLPRYYDKKLSEMFPELFQKIKKKRVDSIKIIDKDLTKQRLKVREKIHELKKAKLKRGYENET